MKEVFDAYPLLTTTNHTEIYERSVWRVPNFDIYKLYINRWKKCLTYTLLYVFELLTLYIPEIPN